MIRDFLIINCTGKNNIIGLKLNNNFFTKKIQTNNNLNDKLVSNIVSFLKKYNVKVDNNFSIIVNRGPGSFSTIRVSIAVAKGIKIAKGAQLYGYKGSQINQFTLKNIEFLISKNFLEKKLIKPIYLS